MKQKDCVYSNNMYTSWFGDFFTGKRRPRTYIHSHTNLSLERKTLKVYVGVKDQK